MAPHFFMLISQTSARFMSVQKDQWLTCNATSPVPKTFQWCWERANYEYLPFLSAGLNWLSNAEEYLFSWALQAGGGRWFKWLRVVISCMSIKQEVEGNLNTAGSGRAVQSCHSCCSSVLFVTEVICTLISSNQVYHISAAWLGGWAEDWGTQEKHLRVCIIITWPLRSITDSSMQVLRPNNTQIELAYSQVKTVSLGMSHILSSVYFYLM